MLFLSQKDLRQVASPMALLPWVLPERTALRVMLPSTGDVVEALRVWMLPACGLRVCI
jgi:hypothetical protein